MEERALADVFVDTFLLEGVAPIRAHLPVNLLDPETNLVAGLRVDDFGPVVAGGPYPTLEAMLAAFYANQAAFNADPSRNRIAMQGTVREMSGDDDRVLVVIDITYRDLPLCVYTADSFEDALFVKFDPSQVVKLLGDGFLAGHLRAEMAIPHAGAPLHFWDAVHRGDMRSVQFDGHGTGWLLDGRGERIGRGAVDIESRCGGADPCPDSVDRIRLTPIGGDPLA